MSDRVHQLTKWYHGNYYSCAQIQTLSLEQDLSNLTQPSYSLLMLLLRRIDQLAQLHPIPGKYFQYPLLEFQIPLRLSAAVSINQGGNWDLLSIIKALTSW
jgi:hypothetical protein